MHSEQMKAEVAKRRLVRQAQQALLNSVRQYFQSNTQPSNDANSHSNPQKLPEGQKILLPSQELINSSEINTIGGTLIENTTTESTITAIEADTTSEDEIVWATQNERIAFVPKWCNQKTLFWIKATRSQSSTKKRDCGKL